jgi:hypothetical protein
MMSNKITNFMVYVLAAFAAAGIVAEGLTNTVYAQEQEYAATLGLFQEEIPPTNSTATGKVEFTVMEDSIQYTVDIPSIQNVTAGHIHYGGQNETGPIIVTLFNYDSPMNSVAENGSITAEDLEGPLVGQNITQLVTAMDNGQTYINIPTLKYPNGEIRGDP